MSSGTKTTITANGIHEKTKEVDIPAILLELGHALVLLVAFLGRLAYYYGEAIWKLVNPPPAKSVRGKVVLITGTGHGIGKELALLYASQGATVVGWDIDPANNERTVKEIKELGYPRAHAYVCDTSKKENVYELARQVQREVGDVDVLINNAGIMPTRPLMEQSDAEIERQVGINLMAHFWTIRSFLPRMIERNDGHIVSLSSMAGRMGLVNLVPYCATKYAVRGLMDALNEELRAANANNRVQLTSIFPYMVDTGLCKNPSIRFPNLMPIEKPKKVAAEIYYAQTHGIEERSIPAHLKSFVGVPRIIMPDRACRDLLDTFNAFVESDKNK